ncbi:hypothetical protein EV715DRAFT_259962 [Schizophyllum commune]
MQHFGKGALRVAKNYTKGYSDVQAKVREATSNDPWGPSGTQMNEIAQMTYNQQDFVEIMEMLDKRLNDKGKNWRHVFKSLTVIDYCLHQGSENVVIYFKDNMYVIKTLKEFQYIDEEGKDQGANVRQKAKDITNLLSDEGRLREERRARASMRDRMLRVPGGADDDEPDENDVRRDQRRPRREEDELRHAIEESKRSLAQDRLKAEERELQEAIRLSKEEEEKRARAVDDSNARSLFDDTQDQPNSNPFPNMLDPAPYATGLQPQFTAAPQFIQPQFTSFNPYQQQMEMQQQQLLLQQQQQQQQEEWMRQQQQEEWMRQQAMLQQQQQQQQQEEWLRQQMLLQQQQQAQQQQPFLMAHPTGMGSNNPFAPSPSAQSPPPSNTLSPPSFNLQGTYDNNSQPPSFGGMSPSPGPSPSPQPGGQGIKVKTRENENERLATLFANRDDGQDTFGNVGALRYGNAAGRNIIAQQTGASHNPFAMQQQQQQPQQQQAEQPFFSV